MGKLQGKTFSISGKTDTVRKRLVEMIESAGGKYIREVSGKVNMLITAPDAYTKDTEKLERAKSLGVSLIMEADFMRMLNPA